MLIYIILLAFVLLGGFAVLVPKGNIKKKNIIYLNLAFIAIFLIYSLRASTVGRDLPGYEEAYELSNVISFARLGIGNFERGYLFLMWICNKLNLSFQWFLTICNAIILVPIYIFIRKYSKNVFLSTIIYICYMFFEFNMTGLRQAIASSIVLIAITVLLESKRYGLLKYILIVLLATKFHSAAYAAFLYLPFHYMKKSKTYTISIACLGAFFLVARGPIMSIIKASFEKDSMNTNAGLHIGLNMVFLLALAAVFTVSGFKREKDIQLMSFVPQGSAALLEKPMGFSDALFEKMFYLSIALLFLFGADTAVRSYMILNQVIFVLLPNSIINLFDKKAEKVITGGLILFFIAFFFSNTLIGGGFDVVPYKFFWQM